MEKSGIAIKLLIDFGDGPLVVPKYLVRQFILSGQPDHCRGSRNDIIINCPDMHIPGNIDDLGVNPFADVNKAGNMFLSQLASVIMYLGWNVTPSSLYCRRVETTSSK